MSRAGLWLWLAALLAFAFPAHADRMDLIKRRGEVIIGVKADYAPFGMLDAEGKLIGIEPDLAADLARRLGVGLQLSTVTSANRLQKLEEGSVDLIFATLGDTPQRREIATLIEPGYFASGANLMLRPDATRFREWSDLTGQTICATQGALFNTEIARRYLFELSVYNGTRDARRAMRDGRCIGWIYDDIAILNLLKEPDWVDYRMPLPTAVATAWVSALSRSERGSALERFVGDTIADWHRTGFLLQTFAKWGVPPGPYLERMARLWTQKKPDGAWLCERQPNGQWPAECRDESRLTSADVTGLARLTLALRERTGLDFGFVSDPFERGRLIKGLVLTLVLVALSIAGSLVVGILAARAMSARIPLIAPLVSGIAAVFRMTPPLLQIYLVFFGIGTWLAASTGVHVPALLAAVLCFSLYAGAANAAAIAEAFDTLGPRAQAPGALHEALRRSWTSVMSSCVNIAKATGMASAIAVPELIYAANGIVVENGNAGTVMNVLMLGYFLIVLAVVGLFAAVGRRAFGA
jgi:polar amino acid transport system substrate-binding protein